MTAHPQALSASPQTPSLDIDWDLLLLLARTEAALTWPGEISPDGSDLSLPDGLDLRHSCDIDWLSRVVDLAEECAPPTNAAPAPRWAS